METIISLNEQKTRLWALAYERSGDVVCCENCGTVNKVRRLSANCNAAPRRRPQLGTKDFTDIIADYVEPSSISQLLLSHGTMPPPVALPIFRQVCRSLGQSPGRKLQVGEYPSYMSPEQCLGEPIDERSQIYSLGCLMYEALTGKPPFVAESPLQIMMQHLKKSPDRMTLSGYPGSVKMAAVLRRCLSKKPSRRYQSLAALEAELAQLPIIETFAPEAQAIVAETVRSQPQRTSQSHLRSGAPGLAAAVSIAVILACLARGRASR